MVICLLMYKFKCSTYISGMNKEKVKDFIFNVFSPVALGAVVGLLTKDDFSYLDTLNRKINIPNITFPIVWTGLYLLQGIWYNQYLKLEDNKTIKTIYWASIAVNLLFTPILFTFHLPLLAMIDVIVLIGLIGYLFFYCLKKKYKIAYLYLPYMIWLIIAFSLMLDILIHN